MGNRKVEFDTESGPSAAIADPRLLDGRIGVEHRLPVDLVYAGVNVAADVRENRAPQILVFQIERAQFVDFSLTSNFLSERVQITKTPLRKLESRKRITQSGAISAASCSPGGSVADIPEHSNH